MRFTAEQTFTADPTTVLTAYASPALYESLPEFGRIALVEVVDHSTSDGRIDLRLRYRFTAPLPAAATAIIDPEKLTWVQHTSFDTGARTAEITFHPDHYADKMTASAAGSFEASSDGGTLRRISGDLKVRVPLVGSKVEKVIVEGLEEHLAEESRLVAAQLGGG